MDFSHLKSLSPQFITFEGGEGVGKTTAVNHFCAFLAEQGVPFVRTREPGGSELAEALREHLLAPSKTMSVDTELLLVFTARSDHWQKTIAPALEDGCWVVCDRFLDSTVAYQGFGWWQGNEQGLQKIATLAQLFLPRLPDVSFWLDLDIKIGMARAVKRGKLDRLEQQNMAFFERVYQGFCYQHEHNNERICRIDASGDEQAVLTQIVKALAMKYDIV